MTPSRVVVSPSVAQQAQRIILTVQEFDDVEPAIDALAHLFWAAFDVDALRNRIAQFAEYGLLDALDFGRAEPFS